MNTIIKTPILLLLLLMGTIQSLFAREDSLYLNFKQIQPFRYVVSYGNTSDGSNTLLKIMDSDGNLLLKNSFQGPIKKIYNFQELPKGDYTIILENEHSTMIQPLIKKKEMASFEISQRKLVNYPVIQVSSKNQVSVDLRTFNFKTKVKIIFEEDQHNYQEIIPLKDSRNYIFKLDKLPIGNYRVKLRVGDKLIQRDLTI